MVLEIICILINTLLGVVSERKRRKQRDVGMQNAYNQIVFTSQLNKKPTNAFNIYSTGKKVIFLKSSVSLKIAKYLFV